MTDIHALAAVLHEDFNKDDGAGATFILQSLGSPQERLQVLSEAIHDLPHAIHMNEDAQGNFTVTDSGNPYDTEHQDNIGQFAFFPASLFKDDKSNQ